MSALLELYISMLSFAFYLFLPISVSISLILFVSLLPLFISLYPLLSLLMKDNRLFLILTRHPCMPSLQRDNHFYLYSFIYRLVHLFHRKAFYLKLWPSQCYYNLFSHQDIDCTVPIFGPNECLRDAEEINCLLGSKHLFLMSYNHVHTNTSSFVLNTEYYVLMYSNKTKL